MKRVFIKEKGGNARTRGWRFSCLFRFKLHTQGNVFRKHGVGFESLPEKDHV